MNERKRKVAFHTLGCKVNTYETEAMAKQMEKAGYEITDFESAADVYIVNTCSVTNVADRKSRQMLRKAKKESPNSVIVAAGCYVQAKAKELLDSKDVDIIVGNNLKKDIAKIVNEYFQSENKTLDLEALPQSFLLDIHKEREFEEFDAVGNADHTRAFIKIQDGCNQFCSYCIIPFTRGRVRSRRPNEILKEVSEWTNKGYKEIVLTGIHISSYGVDFKSKENFETKQSYAAAIDIQHENDKMDYNERDSLLADLIKEMAKVKGVERIRLSSLEPRIVTEDFLRTMSEILQFCPHFHLSLQSGCDSILKKMNRKYTANEYRLGVQRIRKYFPKAAITTDVIVGFPMESEEEFRESLDFVREMNFAEIHVFPYSKREGTRAAEFQETLSKVQKQSRAKQMIALGEEMKLRFQESFVQKEVSVLLEKGEVDFEGKSYLIGHTKEYLKVAVAKEMFEANDSITGIITSEKILDMPLLSEIKRK